MFLPLQLNLPLLIGGLIYYPFITALDKQYLKEEQAAPAEEIGG